jgi:hypothetical protein
MKSRHFFGSLALWILLGFVTLSAQESSKSASGREVKHPPSSMVPKASGLRGIVVANPTPELKGRFFKEGTISEPPALIDQDIVVTALDQRSPAVAAGLQVGDAIAAIILRGEDANENPPKLTAEEFRRRAFLCVPDCLVTVERPVFGMPDPPFGKLGNFVVPLASCSLHNLLVGRLGTDYILVFVRESQAYAFKDMKSGHLIPQAYARIFKMAAPLKLVQPLQVVAGNSSDPQEIQQQIDKIRKEPHAVMPPSQAAPSVQGGTSIIIKNGTGYKLSVYLKGPLSRVLEIPADGVETLSVPSGRYEIGARVSSPGISPFYAVEEFAPNTQYSENINFFERR